MRNSSAAPPSERAAWPLPRLRSVALATLLVMLVVLGFVLVFRLRDVLVAIFLAMLLATALRPVMHWLRDRRLPRPLAAFVALAALLTLVVGFLAALLPNALNQARLLVAEIPDLYADLRVTLMESRYQIVRQFGYSLQPTPGLDTESYLDTLAVQAIDLLPAVGYGFFVLVSVVLFTYYWLLYRERSLRGLLLLLPEPRRAATEALWLQIEEKIGAFLRGQALLALVVGVASLAGYWLIGLPYALLVALIAALLELVPFVGPILTAVIAAGVGFSVSPTLGVSAVVVGLIVQQIENTFLAPRIMDETVGVSPVVTLLAIVGFAALLGFGGALLAIPMAAIFQVLFAAWLAHSSAATTEATVQGRDLIARLRYETQDLVQDVRLRLRTKEAVVNNAADETEEDLERVLADLDTLLQQVESEPG